jgi:hypothetical protein
MNIIHVAGLQLSLSLVLIRMFFINLDWFCSMDTTAMYYTWLWNQSRMALQGKPFRNTIETYFGLFGWVFPNVHRLYSYRTREFSLRILLPNL